jgi:NTE family protein
VLPDVETPLGAAARGMARYLITFGPAPRWMHSPGRHPVQVRCELGPAGVARAVRWITGRAVGLALSSGGSKALAHIGVMQVLRERRIVIDAVTGSSGGALAAVAVAFDMPQSLVESRIHDFARQTRLHRFDFHVMPRSGFFKGVRIRRLFESWFPGVELTDARLPVWLLATNVHTGAEVVLDRGAVSDALRASMSIPAAFDPWMVDQVPLIDGAVVNPLPASVLRDAGVGTVIASNVAGQELTLPTRGRSPHLVQTMARMITSMERELIKTQTPLVDVMIRPLVRAHNSFDFSNIDAFIAEGARAARASLDGLTAAECARIAPAVGQDEGQPTPAPAG